jgi:hypothetical protein
MIVNIIEARMDSLKEFINPLRSSIIKGVEVQVVSLIYPHISPSSSLGDKAFKRR